MAEYNINAVTRRVVFTGSAGLGPYAFTFEILDDDDIVVYFNSTKLTKTTDYTVTINANGTGSVNVIVNAGGNIPETPDANDTIIVAGARDIERVTDFVTAGALLASSLNEQLDSLTIFDQQVAEEQKRSLMAPPYDPAHVDDGGTLDMTLPAKATRASKYMAFDSDGNPTALAGTADPLNSVDTAQLIDGAVTTAKLAANAVTTAKIAADAVTQTQVADDAVGQAQIADDAVGTDQIADSAVTASKLALDAAFSAGMLMPYAGTSAPSGWLLAYGQAVSRTTYADLFAAISTTYGNGDGSTTFNLPDLRGRVIAGQDDMGGSSANRLTNQSGGLNGDTLGATGGSETHTLSTAQMPSHSHYVFQNSSFNGGSFSSFSTSDSLRGGVPNDTPDNWQYVFKAGNAAANRGLSSATGSGSAHNNVQPTIILNYIIKT